MEDGEELWHLLDIPLDAFQNVQIVPDFEGTFDKKAIKFRVTSIPKNGEGAVMKYGDESDWHVEDGIHFPHIPPPLPESRLPSLVFDNNLLKLWHLQDRKFKRPLGEFRLRIICSNTNKTPLHRACAELLAILLHDATTETCYLASVCELGNEVEVTDIGFVIRIHGFDDKILVLTVSELVLMTYILCFITCIRCILKAMSFTTSKYKTVLLKAFFSFCKGGSELPTDIKRHRFESCLEILLRRYGNTNMKASSLCSDIRLRCLRSTIWSSTVKVCSLSNIGV